MPSKKRKYNARFPAGRIKKIMQTDEEVGKVAQAVPIIISRTLELFVESLLTKAMKVTMSRNSKTLSPSHVKQCILAESRFDFLKDLVKNIPDVSAAEEKETISADSSPTSSRFSEVNVATRRLAREDSTTSSSSEPKTPLPSELKRPNPLEIETINKIPKLEPPSTKNLTPDIIDLSVKTEEKISRTPNFYQETLNLDDDVPHGGVIKVNPSYAVPSTSTFLTLKPVPPLHRLPVEAPKTPGDTYKQPLFKIDLVSNANTSSPKTPVTPIFNIDFTKNFTNPEIKILDSNQPQNFKHKAIRKEEPPRALQMDLDYLNSGNLQIDEDYDT